MAQNILFNSSGPQKPANTGFTTQLSNKPFTQPWQPKNKPKDPEPQITLKEEPKVEENIKSIIETPIESEPEDQSQSVVNSQSLRSSYPISDAIEQFQ